VGPPPSRRAERAGLPATAAGWTDSLRKCTPHARAWGTLPRMIPVKDNIPRERFPLVTAILVAIVVVAYLLSSDHSGLLALLLCVFFLGLLGPSVEGARGRLRFCGLCLAGILLGLAARSLLEAGSPSLVLFGALGGTVAVLGGYLLLFPRAKVLTLVAIPFYTTLVEVPAALLIGLWLALQLSFGAAGLG
jgi:membrane-associated phospholipid phosphatase